MVLSVVVVWRMNVWNCLNMYICGKPRGRGAAQSIGKKSLQINFEPISCWRSWRYDSAWPSSRWPQPSSGAPGSPPPPSPPPQTTPSRECPVGSQSPLQASRSDSCPCSPNLNKTIMRWVCMSMLLELGGMSHSERVKLTHWKQSSENQTRLTECLK